ncbi:MAG: hypothetical protein ACM3MG_13765 [Bacillota bacterium]
MALSVLSQAGALNPGADLWIIPQLGKSQWAAKLDWYLNFQLSKAARHSSPTIPSYLNEVIKETDLESYYRPVAKTAPLMIGSESLLPNKWVVVIPWDENLHTWTESIIGTWDSLKQPSLRVFLPPGQSTGPFQQACLKIHNAQDFTVVLD